MKYCMFCGKELNDNEQCTCDEASKNVIPTMEEPTLKDVPPTIPTRKRHRSKIGTAFSNLLPFMKALWNTPTKAIQACASNKDLPLANIFYLLYIVSFGLFFVMMMLHISKSANTISSILHLSGTYQFNISLGSSVLLSIIIAFIEILVINLLILISKCFLHGNFSVKQMIAGNCVIFVYPMVLNFIMTIFVFLSLELTFYFWIAKGILMIIMIHHALRPLYNKQENSSFLFGGTFVVTLIFILLTIIICKVFISFAPKLFTTENMHMKPQESYEQNYDDYNPFDDDYFYRYFN